MKRKKYRIREKSPAWYIREAAEWCGVAAVSLLVLGGVYVSLVFLMSIPV